MTKDIIAGQFQLANGTTGRNIMGSIRVSIIDHDAAGRLEYFECPSTSVAHDQSDDLSQSSIGFPVRHTFVDFSSSLMKDTGRLRRVASCPALLEVPERSREQPLRPRADTVQLVAGVCEALDA